ncbi:MAG: hypothetical protein K1X79_10895 [Oligoflexia bacterium]|nr:hypothetical protein [Oligoflexia bacterium]
MKFTVISQFCLALIAVEGQAQSPWSISGHAKLQTALSDINVGTQAIQSADARLNATQSSALGLLEVQAEVLAVDRAFPPALDGTERRRLFDLSARAFSGDEFSAISRVDRASLAWELNELNMRLGRQALTWGNGLALSVMDLVNPFAPTAIDKEYKTGEDMAWAQWTSPSLGDVQGYILPRRDLTTHAIQNSESTAALKWHTRVSSVGVDLDAMLAQHFGEQVIGLGFNREVWQALLRCDITYTKSEESIFFPSGLCNIDRTWSVFGKNLYSFVEYYHNDIGQSAGNQISSVELVQRLERGELFTLDKDYLAFGVRLELHPLVNWHIGDLYNLRDHSGIGQTRLVYDVLQNVQLIFGVDAPHGPNATEFGGYELIDGRSMKTGPRIYTRAALYF